MTYLLMCPKKKRKKEEGGEKKKEQKQTSVDSNQFCCASLRLKQKKTNLPPFSCFRYFLRDICMYVAGPFHLLESVTYIVHGESELSDNATWATNVETRQQIQTKTTAVGGEEGTISWKIESADMGTTLGYGAHRLICSAVQPVTHEIALPAKQTLGP